MPFTREDDLRLSIRIGLTRGLRLVRRMRRQLDEDERAREALERLSCGGSALLAAPLSRSLATPHEKHGPNLGVDSRHSRPSIRVTNER